MKRGSLGALLLAMSLLLPASLFAAQAGRPITLPPDIEALVNVPVDKEFKKPARLKAPAKDDEAGWKRRFQDLRLRLDRTQRLLAIKRAEFYDKLKKGETEKKPRAFAIEGFGIDTERRENEPRYLDPLEREVHDLDKQVGDLKQELRDLDFEASLAGIPEEWRE